MKLPTFITRTIFAEKLLKLRFFIYFRDVPPLERQNGTDVVLILPEGLKVKDIRWLAIWCTRFTVSIILKFSKFYYLIKRKQPDSDCVKRRLR